MKITLIREKRKTIVLTLIDQNNAVLKVPKTLSEKKVSEFLESKKNWLEKKSQKLGLDEMFSKQFDLKNSFYLFGSKVDDFKNIIMGFDQLSESKKDVSIKQLYLSHFSNLEDLAANLSQQTGFKFDKVKPTESTKVWGSFSSAKVMKLNWKLLILPEELIRYVIYHELCHSKHMNHKPQFWNEVSRFCPNFKVLRKELNRYGFLLKRGF